MRATLLWIIIFLNHICHTPASETASSEETTPKSASPKPDHWSKIKNLGVEQALQMQYARSVDLTPLIETLDSSLENPLILEELRQVTNTDVVDGNACVQYSKIDEIDQKYHELYLRYKLTWFLKSVWPTILANNVKSAQEKAMELKKPIGYEILRIAGFILVQRRYRKRTLFSQTASIRKDSVVLQLNSQFVASVKHILERDPLLATSIQEQVLQLQHSHSVDKVDQLHGKLKKQIDLWEFKDDESQSVKSALLQVGNDWKQRTVAVLQLYPDARNSQRSEGFEWKWLHEVSMWVTAKTTLLPIIKCLTSPEAVLPGLPITSEMQFISQSLQFVVSVNDASALLNELKVQIKKFLVDRRKFLSRLWAGAIAIVRITKLGVTLSRTGAVFKIIGGALSIGGVAVTLATAGVAAPLGASLVTGGTAIAVAGTGANVAGHLIITSYNVYLNGTLHKLEINDSKHLEGIHSDLKKLGETVDAISRQSRVLKLQIERFKESEERKARPDYVMIDFVQEFEDATNIVMAKISPELEQASLVKHSASTATVKGFLERMKELSAKEKLSKLNDLDEELLGSEVKFAGIQTGVEIGITAGAVAIATHIGTELAAGIVENSLGGLFGVLHILQAGRDLFKSGEMLETAQETREKLLAKRDVLKEQTAKFMDPTNGLVYIYNVDLGDSSDEPAKPELDFGSADIELDESGPEVKGANFDNPKFAMAEFQKGLREEDQDIVTFLQLFVKDDNVKKHLFSSRPGLYNPLYEAAVFLPDSYDSCATIQQIAAIGQKFGLDVNGYAPKLTTDKCSIKTAREKDFVRRLAKLERSVDTPLNAAIVLEKHIIARCLLRLCADLLPPMRFKSQTSTLTKVHKSFDIWLDLLISNHPDHCGNLYQPPVWSSLHLNAHHEQCEKRDATVA